MGPEEAPVLALIHGLGLSREIWRDFIVRFSADYRILNYDLYGHGKSGPPPSQATLTVYSDQLANLLDHLEIPKATIVGFSIGGMINRRFAMDHKEKLAALVILNSPHNRGKDGQQAVESRAATVREQGAMSTLEDALKRWFSSPYLKTGSGAELVRKWRSQVDPESYAQAAWVLAQGIRELIQPKEPITHPTLVMTCEKDSGSTPKMSHDIASEIEGSEVVVVPQLQHLGLMENLDLFADPISDFLKRNLK